MDTLKRLILQFPRRALRKVSFLWIAVVVFYTWPPLASSILAIFVILSLVLLVLQRRVWLARLRQEHGEQGAMFYIDRLKPPTAYWVRNLVLASGVSAVLAYFLRERFGISWTQWFLMILGLFILQRDLKVFGAFVAYVVTDDGIGLLYGDLRLFLHFGEIDRVTWVEDVEACPERWALFIPAKQASEGVVLSPVNRDGFTQTIDHVFLTPSDPTEFLSHIPSRFVDHS